MTEAQAIIKGVRISTRKVRLVADSIRNLPVEKAMQILVATQKRASLMLAKTLKSAVANAVQKGAQQGELWIVRIEVDGGQTLRRMHIGSRSHVRMYTKRSSHVRIVVSDKKEEKTAAKTETVVAKEEKAEKKVKSVRPVRQAQGKQAQGKKEEVK